jgi:hypothetical protein
VNYNMFNNSYAPYVWVDQNAPQTLAVSGTNLIATHNVQIISNSNYDAYIPAATFYQRLVGSKNNPTNESWLGNAPGFYPNVQVTTSPNVSMVNLEVVYDPINHYQVQVLKVPAGQYATFHLVYTKPLTEIYPDSYFSENTTFQVVDGQFTYNDPSLGLSIPTWAFSDSIYSWKSVPSDKTNTRTVAGEASPYLLNWNRGLINQNSTITITGERLG